MAITFVGSEVNAADTATASWSGSTNTAIAVPQPSGIQTGDLILAIAAYRDANQNAQVAFANTGGQDWQVEWGSVSASQATLSKYQGTWCHYNGTWGSPTIFVRDNVLLTACTTTNPIIMATFAFRSSVSGYNIYPETIAQMYASYAAPTGPPYDVSTTLGDFGGGHEARKSPASNTVGIYFFSSVDDNDWTFQTAGWTSAFSGTDQIRRNSTFSLSAHYQIKSDGTAFANVTNQQDSTLGPDAGQYALTTWSERPDENFVHKPGRTSRYFSPRGFSSNDGQEDLYSLDIASRSQFSDWVFSGTEASLGMWIYFRSFTANEDPRIWVRHRTDRLYRTGTTFAGATGTPDYSWFIGIEQPSATSANPRLRIRWNNDAGITRIATSNFFVAGEWKYLLCTFNRSTGTIANYYGGAGVGMDANTGFTTADWDTTNSHKVVIGNNAPFDSPNTVRDAPIDGYIAHPAAWNKILTEEEAIALNNGADPRSIQGSSLIFYVPDFGAKEDSDRDIIGGRVSTVYNAPGRDFAPNNFKRKTAASYRFTG